MLSTNRKITIYRTVILSVVLYGCETWSRSLREEGRLRVCENRVLRKIFGPKRGKVTREEKKLHDESLMNRAPTKDIVSDQIEKNEMGGACSTYGK